MTAAQIEGAERPNAADTAFQEKFWVFQRAGWAGLALFIAAGLAGLTGRGGPLAQDNAAAGAATVEYPAIARWQTAATLDIRLQTGTQPADVLLPASFVALFEIERVSPLPAKVTASAAGLRYVFARDTGNASATLTFDIRARRPAISGAVHGLEVNCARALIRTLVLP